MSYSVDVHVLLDTTPMKQEEGEEDDDDFKEEI
jgi:hypothetical protein